MKKDTFYRCVIGENQRITAVKTQGYSEGNLGLHKEDKFWVVTHIPTGTRLAADLATTRAAALAEVKQWVVARDDFTHKIQKYMESNAHAKFLKSKYDQIVTEVF